MPDPIIVVAPQAQQDIMVCLPDIPMTDAALLQWLKDRKVLDEEEAYKENEAR